MCKPDHTLALLRREDIVIETPAHAHVFTLSMGRTRNLKKSDAERRLCFDGSISEYRVSLATLEVHCSRWLQTAARSDGQEASLLLLSFAPLLLHSPSLGLVLPIAPVPNAIRASQSISCLLILTIRSNLFVSLSISDRRIWDPVEDAAAPALSLQHRELIAVHFARTVGSPPAPRDLVALGVRDHAYDAPHHDWVLLAHLDGLL